MSTYRILIIDDDEAVLMLLGMYLGGAGYDVINARDGTEGLALMRQERPDAVILDVNMPIMSGFAVMEVISRTKDLRDTPVIFVSVCDQPHVKMKALDLGAEDYIVKPFERTEFLARIKAVLRRRKRYRNVENNMEGDLSNVSLVDLMQTFDMTRKNFMITLNDTGGNIWVDNALVVHASYRGFMGLDGVVRIFYTARGSFSVQFDVCCNCPYEMQMPIPSVLLESMKCIDEAERHLLGTCTSSTMVKIEESIHPEIKRFSNLSPIVVSDLIAFMGGELDGNAIKVASEITANHIHVVTPEMRLPSTDVSDKNIVKLPEASVVKKISNPLEDPKVRFNRLFDAGFDLHKNQQYTEALEVWQEAFRLEPNNRLLSNNIAVLKKKLALD